MRVIGFERVGSAGRSRNFQKPLLVMYDATADSIAAQTANAALIAGSKLADSYCNGEYASCEEATALLRASVNAAEKKVEEQRRKERQGVSSSLSAMASMASTQIVSFVSAASASDASLSGIAGKAAAEGAERPTLNPSASSVESSPREHQVNSVSRPSQSEQHRETQKEEGKRDACNATKNSRFLPGLQSELPNYDPPTTAVIKMPSMNHSSLTPQASSMPAATDTLLPIVSSHIPTTVVCENISVVVKPPSSASPPILQTLTSPAPPTPSLSPLVEEPVGSGIAPAGVSNGLEVYLTPPTGVSDTAVPAAVESQETLASISAADTRGCATFKTSGQTSRELKLYLCPTVAPSGDATPVLMERSGFAKRHHRYFRY